MAFKTIALCDFCENELADDEYFEQVVMRNSPVKEWPFSPEILICKHCAAKLDYQLLKLKLHYSK